MSYSVISQPTSVIGGTVRSHLRYRVVIIAAVMLVIAALLVANFMYRRGGASAATRFEIKTIDRGRIVATVSATGTLSALVTVEVGSQVSGRIKQLLVDFNSATKRGDVLAIIDPELFVAAVEQANAGIAVAEGNLVKAIAQQHDAERQAARYRDLWAQKIITQSDFDTSGTALEAAVAGVAVARGGLAQGQASRHQAQISLDHATITSPIDGLVITRAVNVGQTVAASLQSPTLFVIAEDLRKMQVDTNLSEADVGKVNDGMAVSFVVDAYPGRPFQGIVRQVRNSPQTLQNVVTYDAVIDVDNQHLLLRPGMTATVTLVYADRADALRVPNAALRFTPEGTVLSHPEGASPDGGSAASPEGASHTVWLLRNGAPLAVQVHTGISDGRFTELLSGDRAAGDVVIVDSAAHPAASGKTGPF